MDTVWEQNAAVTAPSAPSSLTIGYPSESGSPTVPGAWWFHMMTQELRNLIVAAGVMPSGTVLNQVATAIQSLIQNSNSNYAVDTGTANNYIVSYSPAVTALTDGLKLRFKILHTNTGASTINPNGLGSVPIYSQQHTALVGNEMLAGGYAEGEWNSTLNGGSGALVLLENTGGASQLASGSYGVTPSVNDSSTKIATTAFANPASSVASSGYVKLPSGIIIQWGSASFSTSGVANTFPITFPSYCRGIMYCITANTPVWTTSPTLVGFTSNSTGAGTYPYITIGF